MLAGAIILVIGLGLILGESLHLPRHWQTVAVGAVLFAFGVFRWATRRPDESSRGGER
jgi:uncharacterized membrane protein